MLRQEFMSVLDVQSRDELLAEVLRFTRPIGSDLVAAMAVVDQPAGPPTFIRVHNTPAAYIETFESQERGSADPVM